MNSCRNISSHIISIALSLTMILTMFPFIVKEDNPEALQRSIYLKEASCEKIEGDINVLGFAPSVVGTTAVTSSNMQMRMIPASAPDSTGLLMDTYVGAGVGSSYLTVSFSTTRDKTNYALGKKYFLALDGEVTITITVLGKSKTQTLTGAQILEDESFSVVPDHKSNTETIDATCINDGRKTCTCTVCGQTLSDEIIPASAAKHKWDAGKVTKSATCTSNGVKTYTCGTCGKNKTETIKKTGHNWNSGKVTKAAKYFSTGIRTYTCTKCKKTRTETIPKLNAAKVTPAKVKLKGATVTNKKLTVKWKRVAKNTTGYQVSLKNKNTGKVNNYTVKQGKKATLSKTISKLQKKKTYAVRVRAYHKIGTEIIYGKWSKVLSGKV